MAISLETADRMRKIEHMRSIGVIPYAQKFERTNAIADIVELGKSMPAVSDTGESAASATSADTHGTIGDGTVYRIAGRVLLARSFGKLMFLTIQDASGTLQVMASAEASKIKASDRALFDGKAGITDYKFIEKFIDIGDFVGISGTLFRTKKGELTIMTEELTMLSKAIHPLPDKWNGISDMELVYRQRYLDLITNEESYQRFLFRSKFIKTLRDFYDEEGFIELETPVLGNSASGAAAAPFTTHHNDFDIDMFLRISPETSLKKATVGRFERVFEIARDFRNEGSDPSHHQEFTMVEHYAAYWSYEENMAFCERMIQTLFRRLGLPATVAIEDKEGKVSEIDFLAKWLRIDYVSQIEKDSGINIMGYKMGQEKDLRAAIESKGIKIAGIEKMSLAVMVDYLYKKMTRPKIAGPAIIYNYPKFMQPLARTSDANPEIVEQFQVVVNGWEIIKAYSELVDPVDQRARFVEQAKAIESGDEEATSADYEFVQAMEYGMPPQSGLGFGIDRFLALITGQKNLRDVILFPLVKPIDLE